jgi:hypothetical protein
MYRNLNGGVYVNLGDWIDSYTYAVFDGKNVELKTWQTDVGARRIRRR